MKQTVLTIAALVAGIGFAKVEPLSPVGGTTVAVVPAPQKKVMALPTLAERLKLFEDDKASGKVLRHDKMWRKACPLVLKWRSTAGEPGPWKVEIGQRPDLSDARVWYFGVQKKDAATGRETGATAPKSPLQEFEQTVPMANLEIASTYFWRVTSRARCGFGCGPLHGCKESKNIVSSEIAAFRTEDVTPRWIAIEGKVGNIRDLGGRCTADGRRVKQGLIYRGQGLNDNSVTGEEPGRNRLTAEDIKYLTGTLGIRTDLDLRGGGEIAGMKTSPLGEKVRFIWQPGEAYKGIFRESGKKAMAKNFRVFCARENYPIYLHCIGGADRAGSLAYVLNGILGVDRHDLETDWESTFYPKIPDANPDPEFWCRESHFNNGFSKYGKEGDTWTKRIELYLLDCGVTEAEIAAFRKIMLEGSGYEASWDSLNTRPCPAWWRDAKFGIFIHWGVYSVPAFAPYDKSSVYGCYAEHYGNPKHWKDYPQISAYHAKHCPNKSYSDLAADFTAADFNPTAWADLIKRSGAKYVVLTSKHHDGFALWPSACSPYFNASVMGPKRDICGDLTDAVKAAGLHMGFYYSLLEWNHPLYNTNDINKFVEQVNLPQLKELVERYRPDIVWTDGEWDYPWPVWKGPEFLSWLYNESPVKDTVVVNDRWGKRFRGNCGDHYTTEYEDLTNDGKASDSHPWEECRGIGLSFGYNKFETTEHYLSNEACIETLCDKVSRGGNLLLNIGPTADGLIPVIMEERLLAMGKWLSVNGEAIYGTKAWDKRPKNMKKSRVYFTQKGDVVYAIVFGSTEKVVVPDCNTLKSVSLLGSDRDIKWTRENGNVEIEMPVFRQGQAPCDYALVFMLVQ